ncbi:MAG: hypothetical protein ABUL65_02315 [Opitutus sp.]
MIRGALLCLLGLTLAGCQSGGSGQTTVEPLVARFFLEVPPGATGAAVELPVSKVRLGVNPKPVFGEYDIAGLEVVKVDLGWCLRFAFTPAAARDLYRMSVTAQGRRLVLFFNSTAVGVRQLDPSVGQQGLMIFVEVPNEELIPLADRIRRTSAGLQAKAK